MGNMLEGLIEEEGEELYLTGNYEYAGVASNGNLERFIFHVTGLE
jgi:hypothetical protein